MATTLAAGVVLAMTATACSSPTTAHDDSSATESPVTSDGPATPTIPPGAGGVAGPDEPVDPTAEPSPTWDADARAAALEHATATMTAFARPTADALGDEVTERWWAGLAPLLTVSGQQAYAAVDPAEVPPQQVTGEAVLVDDTSAWLARVRVPTDVGDYTLLLVRADPDNPDDSSADPSVNLWATETITPPAALSQPAGR